MFSLLKVSTVHKIYGAADFSKQIIAAVVPHYWFAPFCFQSFPVSEGSALRPWVSELFHKITTSLVVCLDLCLPDVASYIVILSIYSSHFIRDVLKGCTIPIGIKVGWTGSSRQNFLTKFSPYIEIIHFSYQFMFCQLVVLSQTLSAINGSLRSRR